MQNTIVKMVSTFDELCCAFKLGYKKYLEAGYVNENSSGMRYSIHQLLGQSCTLIAINNNKIIGTSSLVGNSVYGFPSTPVFGDLFDALTIQGRKVYEGTMLACEEINDCKASLTAQQLIATTINRGIYLGHDDYCVIVNPKHAKIWEEILDFERIGEARSCGYVKNHPGIFFRINLNTAKDTTNLSKILSKYPLEPELANLAMYTLTGNDIANLLISNADMLDDATEKQFSALSKQFTNLMINEN